MTGLRVLEEVSKAINESLDRDRFEYLLERDIIGYSDLPEKLQNDKDFLIDCMFDLPFYLSFPKHLQQDVDIAVEALRQTYGDDDLPIIREIFKIPAIRGNIEAWKNLIDCEYENLIGELAPDSILQNRYLMLRVATESGDRDWHLIPDNWKEDVAFLRDVKNHFVHQAKTYRASLLQRAPHWLQDDKPTILEICRGEPPAYEYASDRLKADEDLICVVWQAGGLGSLLSHAPSGYIQSRPSLVAQAFGRVRSLYTVNSIVESVPIEFWSLMSVVQAYLKAGGRPHGFIAPELWTNVDISYLCFQSAGMLQQEMFNPYSFVPKSIWQERSFLMRLAKEGLLFGTERLATDFQVSRFVPGAVQLDRELILTTVSWHNMEAIPGSMRMGIAASITNQLVLDASFQVFLNGIGILRPKIHPWYRCPLPRLDIEPIKRLIASYAGVSTGRILKLERECLDIAIQWKHTRDEELETIAVKSRKHLWFYSGALLA